jgi:hypothetical protein
MSSALNVFLTTAALALCLRGGALAGPPGGTNAPKTVAEKSSPGGGGFDAFTDEDRNSVDFYFKGGKVHEFR